MVPKVTKFIKIIHTKDIEINRGIIEHCNEEMDNFLESSDVAWPFRHQPSRCRTMLTTAECSFSSSVIDA
jgi:predicted metal-dependent TIM-barrel fold hydrolase